MIVTVWAYDSKFKKFSIFSSIGIKNSEFMLLLIIDKNITKYPRVLYFKTTLKINLIKTTRRSNNLI